VKRRKLCTILRRNGLEQTAGRGKGSHAYFEHPDDAEKATIVPHYNEIGPELLRQILTQAGKTRPEYEPRLRGR